MQVKSEFLGRSTTCWGAEPGAARWLDVPHDRALPVVCAFRCRFRAVSHRTHVLHVSADERYRLYLDGTAVASGPERGDAHHWFYESVEVELIAGEHVLVALVWALGAARGLSPGAQQSVRPGFILQSASIDNVPLSTGVGTWDVKVLTGYTFAPPSNLGGVWYSGAAESLDGRNFPWDVILGGGDDWTPAPVGNPGMSQGFPAGRVDLHHHLHPSQLPPMIDIRRSVGSVIHAASSRRPFGDDDPVATQEHETALGSAWQSLLMHRRAVPLACWSHTRIIVDLGNYFCFYPSISAAGGKGARIEVRVAEALYTTADPNCHIKRRVGAVDGCYFRGIKDSYVADGGFGRRFEPLWWRAGRFLEITIATADEPIEIIDLSIRETRYPFEAEGEFACSEGRWANAADLMIRTIQACSHETFLDCPYYEQMMYIGDSRLEALCLYATTFDERLTRKAIAAFDWSRLPNGLPQSRYPSRAQQLIPPFALWWVAMVHDYAMWRDDPIFVRRRMPGVRAILECFREFIDTQGLVRPVPGWNFIDWVPQWPSGVPPHAATEPNAILQWHVVLALDLKARLEAFIGEPELAGRDRALAQSVAEAAIRLFWHSGRSLFADNLSKSFFSEHAQCMAIISGHLDEEKRSSAMRSLVVDRELAETTIYFSHYLFEACYITRCAHPLFERFNHWLELPGLGFCTTPEMPEPTRSDCHAWGAHPLFHARATILGVRPESPGFRSFSVKPLLGPLDFATGSLPHPRGIIKVEVRRHDGRLLGSVQCPAGLDGFVYANETRYRISAGCVDFA